MCLRFFFFCLFTFTATHVTTKICWDDVHICALTEEIPASPLMNHMKQLLCMAGSWLRSASFGLDTAFQLSHHPLPHHLIILSVLKSCLTPFPSHPHCSNIKVSWCLWPLFLTWPSTATYLPMRSLFLLSLDPPSASPSWGFGGGRWESLAGT